MPSWYARCQRSPRRLDCGDLVMRCIRRDSSPSGRFDPGRSSKQMRPRVKQKTQLLTMKTTLQLVPVVFKSLMMALRSLMRNIQSLIMEIRPLVKRLPLPKMTLRPLLAMTCPLLEGCLGITAVCLGCALVGAPSLQHYPPQACCPGFARVGVPSQRP